MAKNYDSLKLSNQLCFPLYASSKEVIKQYTPFLNELELTYTQYIAMMVMWEHETLNVKQMGEFLYLDSGTLTPVLKSLEKKGYITRKRSSEDERVMIVSITKPGKDLKEKAVDIPKKVGNCIKMKKEEAETLYKLLYSLLENLK